MTLQQFITYYYRRNPFNASRRLVEEGIASAEVMVKLREMLSSDDLELRGLGSIMFRELIEKEKLIIVERYNEKYPNGNT